MNELQIKLQLDDNQPARWFDVETINFDDEVCFTDGVGEHIEIEYQGEPLRIKSPSLTDGQQVVLKWLKQYREEQGENPLNTVFTMIEMYSVDPSYDGAVPLPTKVKEAYKNLNDEQEFQVLAAFAEWGLANG